MKEKLNKNCIPKNCEKYIKNNLKLIERRKKEKIEEENKYNGSNYDKFKKIKFNCKGPLYQNKKLNIKNIKKEKEEEDFIIHFTLPNKKIIDFPVNVNEDMEEKVDEFCKIYCLNDNIKEKIINQIETFKDSYEQESDNDD